MHVAVFVEAGYALPVVDTDPEDTVVARSLQALVEHFLVEILRALRCPIIEDAHATLAIDRAIDGIGAIEGQAIGTRLHIVPAERHLREPEPEPVDLVFGKVDVAITVAELREIGHSITRSGHAGGEVRLDIESGWI